MKRPIRTLEEVASDALDAFECAETYAEWIAALAHAMEKELAGPAGPDPWLMGSLASLIRHLAGESQGQLFQASTETKVKLASDRIEE